MVRIYTQILSPCYLLFDKDVLIVVVILVYMLIGTKIDNKTEGYEDYIYDLRYYISLELIHANEELLNHYNIDIGTWKQEYDKCMIRLKIWFGISVGCINELISVPRLTTNRALVEVNSVITNESQQHNEDQIVADPVNTDLLPHLSFTNSSLILAGVQNEGQPLMNQIPHYDFGNAIVDGVDVSLSENHLLENMTLPGSIMVCLTAAGRWIMFYGQSKPLHIPFGYLLYFTGTSSHGGYTVSSTEEFKWNECFHCLLTSSLHPSDPSEFNLDPNAIALEAPVMLGRLNEINQLVHLIIATNRESVLLKACTIMSNTEESKKVLAVLEANRNLLELMIDKYVASFKNDDLKSTITKRNIEVSKRESFLNMRKKLKLAIVMDPSTILSD